MTIKALISTVATFALMSTVSANALDEHAGWSETVEAALQSVNLTHEEITHIQGVIQNFRAERKKASTAMRRAGEALPPQAEVLAVRTYSDAGLEVRLTHLLTDEQLTALMDAIEEQRELQGRLHAQR